jgi:hypothetical protein
MSTLIVLSDLAAPATFRRGGHAMFVLQWLHGLERLGHHVLFIEFLKEHPGEGAASLVRCFDETVTGWWDADQSSLIVETSTETLYGLDAAQVKRIAEEASAVITLAAPYRREPYPLIGDVRPRVLVEQDPGYTHLWAAQGDPLDVYGEHDLYYTVGGNIGSSRCSLPTLGLPWQPIWNPVVMDWWSEEPPLRRNYLTTIADWRGYGYLEHEGRILGPKAEEFRRFLRLPRLIGEPLGLALDIDPDDPDLADLEECGWKVESPKVVGDADLYRDYVAGSLGEFSCAKGGYAGTRCGWFSDRSACYLAAGRPVVLQATGFEDLLPTGKGLFAVATVEEAVEAGRAIRRDYSLHAAAARRLAREHLDSDKVLRRLLAEVGVTSPGRVSAAAR